MLAKGVCIHCGESGKTTIQQLYFEPARKELELELCADCQREISAEDGISRTLRH